MSIHTAVLVSAYCHSCDTVRDVDAETFIGSHSGHCAHALSCGHIRICDRASHGFTTTADEYADACMTIADGDVWFLRKFLESCTRYDVGAARRRAHCPATASTPTP